MSRCVALVLAAGRGRRLGGGVPKPYRMVGGIPMVRYALLSFVGHAQVDSVRAVIHPDDEDLFASAAGDLDLLEPVHGGATRQDSVRLGLESLAGSAPGRVLIHDAARPFITEGLISRVLAALDGVPGAIPALPVRDTLKRGADALVAGTVDRADLWRAQTPQGFRFADILAAHRQHAGVGLTDDAAVAERAGLSVAIVAGDEDNVKVTTESDLSRVQRLFAGGETRAGFGFDVHRFGPGDHVMLCGVRVPFEAGLEGHSDADVGLHALTDALLGAIGAEDIGSHFSPDDPAWRDEPSDTFLRRAGELVAESGGTITNLDVTLICERPRIDPHRAAMTARIADILGLSVGQVSVKATTTDRIGFIGHGEGIAAQAVASVRRPFDVPFGP